MEDFDWNVVHEGQLLDAMVGHKPVGVNKYFQMAFICDKFTDILNKDVNPDKIWSHLETMYNLEALDESESIPFPNSEKEFVLPDSDFGSLLIKKDEEKNNKPPQKGRETPKNLKESKKEENKSTPVRNSKEVPRRDSKDSKDSSKTPQNAKKEVKKETEKPKAAAKGRNSVSTPKEDAKTKNSKEETPKQPQPKRPTRGSLKPNDDSGSSGKSSPITVTPAVKRRRI